MMISRPWKISLRSPAGGSDTKRALSVKQKPFDEGVREEPEIGAPTRTSAPGYPHRRRYALSPGCC